MENATHDAIRYAEGALATLKRAGCSNLRVFCLGCGHWHWLRIDDAIARLGASAGLVMVARRVRCHCCGTKGAHVEPEEPPGIGTPHYLAWALARRTWLRAELERFQDLDEWLPPGQAQG
ncbi:hypothetical protein [Niveispirillum cyanobacteriorum]|uniref:Uncharacterized protein n=1 Tax=Niveispirillum cyanobacteriorum TaxID=1612173 RepID=A0A2K9NDP2_9PROT|nr:hypothetical protein [Niveispirillum cyanobacteriorum]AUN31261.1 hypothetical protein C0V82_14215 [Niveispirillum cyanobacteriorum]